MDSKAKSAAMRAIHRNPKLTKEIFDAIDSPIGSTKRKRAHKIMNSMSFMGQRRAPKMDGRGGPGPGGEQNIYSGTPQTQPFEPSPAMKLAMSSPTTQTPPAGSPTEPPPLNYVASGFNPAPKMPGSNIPADSKSAQIIRDKKLVWDGTNY